MTRPSTSLATLALAALALLGGSASAQSDTPLKVIATIPTYGLLAETIGGDLVEVVTLCRPTQDIHAVRATPSLMARCRRADLLFYTGLGAEMWLSDMLRGSDNADLLPGSSRAIALTDGIALKEVPAVVDRSQGDVHAYGNTHVWTDPYLVRGMAARVKDALVAALPASADAINARYNDFHERLTKALVGWLTAAAPLRGRTIVTYHPSWIYLLDRLGLERIGTIEPKPRIAPTASHLDQLAATMEARGCKVILREPYQDPQATEFVAEKTGARVLDLSTHPGYPEGVDGIIEHFDYNIRAISGALEDEH